MSGQLSENESTQAGTVAQWVLSGSLAALFRSGFYFSDLTD